MNKNKDNTYSLTLAAVVGLLISFFTSITRFLGFHLNWPSHQSVLLEFIGSMIIFVVVLKSYQDKKLSYVISGLVALAVFIIAGLSNGYSYFAY